MSLGENTFVEVSFTSILHVFGLAKKLLFVGKPTLLNRVEFGNKKCVIRNNHKKVVTFGVKKIVFMSYNVTPMFTLLCLDKLKNQLIMA
jgi:hypothetical protein